MRIGSYAALTFTILAIATPSTEVFAQSDVAIEEIVVTAQRREEQLSDVPLSITALGGEYLESALISETRNLQFVTPGLTWSASGPFAQPTIRGVGTSVTGLGASPNVALYVDGIYNPMQATGLFEFHNVERIEVLKGPQGTLFGRNATGGAIRIVTKDPQQDPSLFLSAGAGEEGLLESSGYVTGGLSDNLAADFAYAVTQDDGYYRDIVTGARLAERDQLALRSKILFRPSEAVKFVLSGYYSEQNDDSPYATQAIDGNLQALAMDPDTPQPTGPFQVAHSFAPEITSEAAMVALRAEFELASAVITSISAYTDQDSNAVADGDGSVLPLLGFDFPSENETFQQELTIASVDSGEALRWIVGAFYLKDENSRDYFRLTLGSNVLELVGSGTFNTKLNAEAWALFGELTYDFTEQLSVTAGLRYSEEEQTQGYRARHPDYSDKWDDLSPRISVTYAVNDATNLYATYSEGFKSGTFNSNSSAVAPEEISAYEVGIKSRPTDRLSVNASAFHYDYQDIQIQAYLGDSTAVTQLQNAAEANIKGLELEVLAKLSAGFSARLGAAFTDAEYDSFPGATTLDPIPGGGNVGQRIDASGNRMIRTPKFTLNAGLSYQTLVGGGELHMATNVFVSNRFYWDVANRLDQGAYEMINARASWTTPNERMRFSVWGENLADARMGLWVGSSTRGDRVAWARPRIFGATVELFVN